MAATPSSHHVRIKADDDDSQTPQKEIGSSRGPVVADLTLDGTLSAFTDCIQFSSLHSLAVKASHKFRELAQCSEQHFLPMPVRGLPSGKETGKCICIDVGGTNLRVGFVELLGEQGSKGEAQPTQDKEKSRGNPERFRKAHEKSWPIEDHLKMDKAEDLFAWIGACIAEVIRNGYEELSADEKEELILGITFSFPMTQVRLEEATLLPMGKGFAITSNLNLGRMLLAGYQRQCDISEVSGIHSGDPSETRSPNSSASFSLPRLKLTAIANDTIATFISVAYTVTAQPNSRTVMGLIAGTGSNAAIPLKLNRFPNSKIVHSNVKHIGNLSTTDQVVTNTEWSVRPTDEPLSDLGIPTKWDRQLDEQLPSGVQGFQPFEYMTAGRYLGEIVRLVLYDLASSSTSIDTVPHFLTLRNSISTAAVALAAAQRNLAVFANPFAQLPSRLKYMVQPICQAVMDRSAALTAAYVTGLLALAGDVSLGDVGDELAEEAGGDLEDQEDLVIAYTGSLMSSNPEYCRSCEFWINEIAKKSSSKNCGKKVVLKEALDGGIFGAAVLAGTAAATDTRLT
ncbi:MAG: hypothetical protein M1821_000881 [Bathelium mastoideum]|nr:MAG: hypothetical protein M1821_000881 [Bathelium mastoideum]